MRAPHEILHAEQGSTHFIFGNHHTVRAVDEPLIENHRPTNKESCYLEHLQQRQLSHDSYYKSALPRWSRYILSEDTGEHKNQPAISKMTGRRLLQGGSSLKTTPAVVALGQRTGTRPDNPQSRRL